MTTVTTQQQWLVIPGFEGLIGQVDFPALVIGLNLIQLHGDRLAPQRFNCPLASGGLLIGTPTNWLRATYLLERGNFLVEAGGCQGAPFHSTIPVKFDVLLSYLATWLYTGIAHGFTLTEYEQCSTDHQADVFWSEAYGRLLGLPAPAPPVEGSRTYEQQKTDALIRANQQRGLLPEIERLEKELSAYLQSREPKPKRHSRNRRPS